MHYELCCEWENIPYKYTIEYYAHDISSLRKKVKGGGGAIFDFFVCLL